ncbi:MAG: hypothetical protein J5I91_02015 [Bacteroidetes bacterium]|nr:hypothetical protein [Bacteroidota bacterium]
MFALFSCKSTRVPNVSYQKSYSDSYFDYQAPIVQNRFKPIDNNINHESVSIPHVATAQNNSTTNVGTNKLSKGKIISNIKSIMPDAGVKTVSKTSFRHLYKEYKAAKKLLKKKSYSGVDGSDILMGILYLILIVLLLWLFYLFVAAVVPGLTLGAWFLGWAALFLIILIGVWLS